MKMLCENRRAENERLGRKETEDEMFEAITNSAEFQALLAKELPDGKGGEGGEEEEDGEFEAIVGMLCAKREAENKRTGRTETDDEIFEAITKTAEFKAVLAKSMPDGKLREDHDKAHATALKAASGGR